MTFTREERYEGERLMLQSLPDWHGLLGHLNAITPDHKSVVTNYGKHDRVAAFQPSFDSDYGQVVLYARVDHIWNLGTPTADEVLKACRLDQDIKGQWTLLKTTPFESNGGHFECTEYIFVKSKPSIQ